MSKQFIQRLLPLCVLGLLLVGCQRAAPTKVATTPSSEDQSTDLSEIKAYLLQEVQALKTSTRQLQQLADRYYQLATTTDFDYARLWQENPDEVKNVLETARQAWITASPLYEKIEGIVAGTPSLASYDVILDAGSSGTSDPETAVPFDLTLPNGKVLPKPGNLFGVTESTLWGTFAEYTVPTLHADLNGDGAVDFGESLPDANVLKSGADALDSYTGELIDHAERWHPTVRDAFAALVVMIPTMNEYFGSWRDSRFVTGESSTQRDFVAVSRLADIQDILGGLQVVYAEVQPLIATIDQNESEQIAERLSTLKSFVQGIYEQEQAGKRFTPEEAEMLGDEAQNQATAITGQLSQLAAELKISLDTDH